jgi:hypothetical protein
MSIEKKATFFVCVNAKLGKSLYLGDAPIIISLVKSSGRLMDARIPIIAETE